MTEESTLWKGSTSQWWHFRAYVVWLLVAAIIFTASTMLSSPRLISALLIPMAGIYLRWRLTKSTVFELTSKRLRRTTGLLRRKQEELELYRVKETTLEQPFLLRVFGLGNITVTSSDEKMPLVVLTAIPGAYKAREKLRLAVEAEQGRSRVVATSPESAVEPDSP